jgi:hypothetical protein
LAQQAIDLIFFPVSIETEPIEESVFIGFGRSKWNKPQIDNNGFLRGVPAIVYHTSVKGTPRGLDYLSGMAVLTMTKKVTTDMVLGHVLKELGPAGLMDPRTVSTVECR